MRRILALALLLLAAASALAAEPVPVILDTDIGDDIDDTWALVMLLKSPQFDVKLVTTTFGKAEYRAKLIAKLLTVAGRTDVAVGLGAGGMTGTGGQQAWVEDFKLSDYPGLAPAPGGPGTLGRVYADGVQALIDLVHASPQPVVIIEVGPATTLAAALEKDPSIAAKAHFVGMDGSVRKGYGNKAQPEPEWNVKANIPAAQRVLGAPWKSCAITPLDTCGLVTLAGPRFAKLKESSDPLVKAMLENYRIWAKKKDVAELTASSTLFDTCAVYLAQPDARTLMEIETLNIAVTKEGATAIDPAGPKMNVATNWKDLDAYRDALVQRLLGPTVAGKR